VRAARPSTPAFRRLWAAARSPAVGPTFAWVADPTSVDSLAARSEQRYARADGASGRRPFSGRNRRRTWLERADRSGHRSARNRAPVRVPGRASATSAQRADNNATSPRRATRRSCLTPPATAVVPRHVSAAEADRRRSSRVATSAATSTSLSTCRSGRCESLGSAQLSAHVPGRSSVERSPPQFGPRTDMRKWPNHGASSISSIRDSVAWSPWSAAVTARRAMRQTASASGCMAPGGAPSRVGHA
jgi:hypothetical protein